MLRLAFFFGRPLLGGMAPEKIPYFSGERPPIFFPWLSPSVALLVGKLPILDALPYRIPIVKSGAGQDNPRITESLICGCAERVNLTDHHNRSDDQVYYRMRWRRQRYWERCDWYERLHWYLFSFGNESVLVASSTGLLLKTTGLKVTAIKIDPYMNIDAGTMRPTEHGIVCNDLGEEIRLTSFG